MAITAQTMREEVYPRINAADLLNELTPRPTGQAFSLDCPVCERRQKAFYYPGSNVICCNAQNECGVRLSIWDAVAAVRGGSNSEIAKLLYAAAGLELPEDDDHGNTDRSAVSTITRVLAGLLSEGSAGFEYLTDARRLVPADIDRSHLGYYPDTATVAAALERAGADLEQCRAWDVLPKPGSRSRFEHRIVGWWVQPDNTIRLWGRDITGRAQHKYEFAQGLGKTRPYLFQRGLGPQVCVEGTLDAYSLRVVGIPACATGGNLVNAAQARFLAEQGITNLIYLCDAGRAGRDGAIRTMRNCEPLGIATAFHVLRENEDDVDSMRAQGRYQDIRALADAALPGGAYLARMVMMYADELNASSVEMIARMYALRSELTQASAVVFDRVMNSAGVAPAVDSPALLSLVSQMKMRGMGYDDIQHQLKLRYGLTLQFIRA